MEPVPGRGRQGAARAETRREQRPEAQQGCQRVQGKAGGGLAFSPVLMVLAASPGAGPHGTRSDGFAKWHSENCAGDSLWAGNATAADC